MGTDRDYRCDKCGSGLVAAPRPGETTSNKEWSIEWNCPNAPHPDEPEPKADPDMDSLHQIAKKYGN